MVSLALWHWGVLLYLAVHALHIVLWRVLRPRQQFKALVAVFLVLGPVSLLWTVWPELREDFSLFIAPFAVYFCLAAQYIAIYPAFQAISPTLEFLYRMKRAAPQGLTESELAQALGGGAIVAARMEDLLQSGLVVRDSQGTISASPKGRWIGLVFKFYREALLGLPQGAG